MSVNDVSRLVRLTPDETEALRAWLEVRPNGAFLARRVTMEAVEDGGVLIRVDGARVSDNEVSVDPEWQVRAERVLGEWMQRSLVLPGWTVERDGGGAAYRLTFTVASYGHERHYSLTETEFGQYLLGLVDLAPNLVGPLSVALADEMREELTDTGTDYRPGDAPVPEGTEVVYLGTHANGPGRYTVLAHDDPASHPLRTVEEIARAGAYPDGVAYVLWPAGLQVSLGYHDRAVYWEQRTSFRVLRRATREEVGGGHPEE